MGELHPAARPLRDRLDSSPVIGWLKDLDGRYLYANAAYAEQLGTAEQQLLGRTDADLGPHESVEGLRLRVGGSIEDEPLELEYRVPAYEGRPEFAVIRFAVRDHSGGLVGICGVAGATTDTRLVHDECNDLLDLLPGDGEKPEPVNRDAAAVGEPTVAPFDQLIPADPTAELAAELAAERASSVRLRYELDLALTRLEQLERELRARTPVAAGPAMAAGPSVAVRPGMAAGPNLASGPAIAASPAIAAASAVPTIA